MTRELTPELERLLEITAYNAYTVSITGLSGNLRALNGRMREPKPGDWVVEMSTIYYEDRNGTRFGTLVRVADEPVYPEEQRAELGFGPDEPMPTERVWYVRLLDGREFRWTNASFLAVPAEFVSSLPKPEK